MPGDQVLGLPGRGHHREDHPRVTSNHHQHRRGVGVTPPDRDRRRREPQVALDPLAPVIGRTRRRVHRQVVRTQLADPVLQDRDRPVPPASTIEPLGSRTYFGGESRAAAGVSKPEPRKRPRAANRRFVYPAPNCCWQLNAFAWSLADGTHVTIHQLIEDHSRMALATLVADGETARAVVLVVSTAVRRWGVPQRLLSDNGLRSTPPVAASPASSWTT